MADREILSSEHFNIRRSEIGSKLALSARRLRMEIEGFRLLGPTKEQAESAAKIESAARYAAGVATDSMWMLALRESHVPVRTILMVWDAKERIDRETNIEANPELG